MAKPLQPAPQVAVYTLAYVLLAVGFAFSLTDSVYLAPSGRLFLPLLAAWLGARFGARGLVPLALAAVLIVPKWEFQLGDGATLSWGIGPVIAGLCAGLTLLFARAAPDEDPDFLSGWRVAVPLVLACLISVGISADFYRTSLALGWGSAAATAAACFLLTVSGRASLGAVCLLAVLVQGAGVALAYAGLNVMAPVGSLESGSIDVFAALGLRNPIGIPLAVAAAIAGFGIRRARGGGPVARPRALVFSGLLALMVLPDLLYGASAGLSERGAASPVAAGPERVIALPEFAAGSRVIAAAAQFDETVAADDGFDEVTLTAQRRTHPSELQPHLFGFVLAALSLAAGLSAGRRMLFWWPIGAALLGACGLLLGDFAEIAFASGPGDFAFDSYTAIDTARYGISQVAGDTAVAWIFVWIGQHVAATRAARGKERPWPGM